MEFTKKVQADIAFCDARSNGAMTASINQMLGIKSEASILAMIKRQVKSFKAFDAPKPSAPKNTEAIICGSLKAETEKAYLLMVADTNDGFHDVWFPKSFASARREMQRKIDFEIYVPAWLLTAKNNELGITIVARIF